jgi:nucleotide-binding universal stress UspA family protein
MSVTSRRFLIKSGLENKSQELERKQTEVRLDYQIPIQQSGRGKVWRNVRAYGRILFYGETPMKLLLAVDSVASAELVAASIAARPWGPDTRARVLTVIDYALIPVELANETGGQMRLIRPEMEKRARPITARAMDVIRQYGLEAEEEVTGGDPRDVIVDHAEAWAADFIFVRSHVYTDLSRWMLGSVAQEVLRRAPCSVGIIRATTDDGAGDGKGGMRILLATDGSEYSLAAARSVSERQWPDGTEVKVISVVNPNVRSVYGVAEVMITQEGEAEGLEGAVKEAIQIVRNSGLKANGETTVGSAKSLIVTRAKEWNAHLVVVGSHGRRGSKRLFLGSVSEFVANNAHCSTEVIRIARTEQL